jgi:uncharacterized protein (DUF362 family)
MRTKEASRRDFLRACAAAAITGAAAARGDPAARQKRPAVSVVRIKDGNVAAAVERAIDLLGGIKTVTDGRDRIMLKPNLVSPLPNATTKPEVIRALAQLMKRARKQVLIGEGSAAAAPFNVQGREIFRTKKRDVLDAMQQFVFKELGYTDLAQSLGVPLVNLHSGELAEAKVPNAFVFPTLIIHRSLQEIDLLCSVPMMKTHALAMVTLGMKNLIGVYPGTVYQSVRGEVHDLTAKVEPSGTAAAIVDMVRANKLGLVVVDGSMAMEGNGPTEGTLVKMDVIVAGTDPVATDMVASSIMGIEPAEVPAFAWANKAGLGPTALKEIEVLGEKIEKVRRNFVKPTIYPWDSVRGVWGVKVIARAAPRAPCPADAAA